MDIFMTFSLLRQATSSNRSSCPLFDGRLQ
jgi:hypothetical protein